jgi:hypothetical protein
MLAVLDTDGARDTGVSYPDIPERASREGASIGRIILVRHSNFLSGLR